MPEIPLAAAVLGSAIIGGGASIFGASKAADAQKSAASQASATQMAMFQQALAQGRDLFNIGKGEEQPFIDQGADALGSLKRLTMPGADMTSELEKTPGYLFALSQGEKGVTNQATMSGLSGNALRGGAEFAKGLASNTWSDVVNKLLEQFKTGAGVSTALGNQAVGFGGSVMGNANSVGGKLGENILGAGNATAGADIATANAVSGGVGSISNSLMLNALTGGKLFGGTNSGAWGGSAAATPYPNAPFSGGG